MATHSPAAGAFSGGAWPLDRVRRLGLVVAAIAAAAASLIWNDQFRTVESSVAALVASPFTHAQAIGQLVVTGLRTPHTCALLITPECTSALLMLPCAAAFCLQVLFRGVSCTRAVLGLIIAAALLFTVNQCRIGLIEAAWMRWGHSGFWFAHTIMGSLLSLTAVLIALILQIRIGAAGATGRPPARTY